MTKPLLVLILLLSSVPGASVVAQIDAEGSRKTLARIAALSVLVEEIDEEAQRDGLSDADIQSDVERALRKAGLKVLGEDEAPRETPVLYVLVLTNKGSTGLYGFAVSLRVMQWVRLVRDTSVATLATTWEAMPTIGTVGGEHVERLRAEVLDSVSGFLIAYRVANPN